MYSGGKPTDGNYSLLSEAIENGLFHPRCKDSTSTYYEGITTLKPVTSEEMAEMDRREKLEQQHSYYQNQANKNQRIADYSLDEDNHRMYQHRAEKFREQSEKISYFVDEQKSYRPVHNGGITETFKRKIDKDRMITIKAYKTTAQNDIYISEKVNIKRKDLHEFDKDVNEVYKLLQESNSKNKPKILIISSEEMGSNAIASYIPTQNILNINVTYFNIDNIAELQKDFACPSNKQSTMLHELIHWQDAEKYRRKFGEITDFKAYSEYLNIIFAPKVEKIINNGYNISDISEYALKKYIEGEFDEVYAEYRVKELLGR